MTTRIPIAFDHISLGDLVEVETFSSGVTTIRRGIVTGYQVCNGERIRLNLGVEEYKSLFGLHGIGPSGEWFILEAGDPR